MPRKLSTIEMTLLGMAYLRGPCTTYALMKELSSSSSTYYKSRAGTAYSVTKRLLKFGYLAESDDLIQISPTGLKALQDWVAPPLTPSEIAHSADLLRLRFFFLGALSPSDRLAFIDASIQGLLDFQTRCESLIAENEKIGDYFGALATVSIVLETRARIQWMRIVRRWVEEPIPDGTPWAETILEELD